ncbi:MAG: flagellar biosynthesis protein FlgM [Phycisphaerales bacterium]
MNNISPANSSPALSIHAARPTAKPGPAPAGEPRLTLAPVDRVDISPEARAAESSADRVTRVRQQLADGTYLHPDKLDIALDKLLDQLG